MRVVALLSSIPVLRKGKGSHRQVKEGGCGLRGRGCAGHPVVRPDIPLLTQHPAAGPAHALVVVEPTVQVQWPQRLCAGHELQHNLRILCLQDKNRGSVFNAFDSKDCLNVSSFRQRLCRREALNMGGEKAHACISTEP